MQRKKFRSVFAALSILLCCTGVCAAVFGGAVRGEVAVFAREDSAAVGSFAATVVSGAAGTEKLPEVDLQDVTLVPGGIPFGIKMTTDGIVVVRMGAVEGAGGGNPGREAGLRAGDLITSVNGEDGVGPEGLLDAVARSGGDPIALTFVRDGEEYETSVTPLMSESAGEYRLGIWVKDTAAGIGTVTFYDPESGFFAGLGHGICDAETGLLLPLAGGDVYGVRIGSISRGEAGVPGEIRGCFEAPKIGALIENTPYGAFGYYAAEPDGLGGEMPVAVPDEVEEGPAQIICTLGGDGPRRYSVGLSHVNEQDSNDKNFIVTVTDPALIGRTGGIVQGMSGSPVIQNGKLVGALTHVLVDDPTRGFGIFLANMLAAAQDSAQ